MFVVGKDDAEEGDVVCIVCFSVVLPQCGNLLGSFLT